MAERSYSRLDDVDVSETIHDHNMRKAISMLSLVSTPNDSLSESAVETFTEEQNLDLELPISFENDSIEVTDMPISSTAAGMPNFWLPNHKIATQQTWKTEAAGTNWSRDSVYLSFLKVFFNAQTI